MAEPMAAELAARAKRVIGMFVVMIGSGVVLESAAVWMGIAVMLAGLGLMAWGLTEATPTPSWATHGPEGDSPAAPRAPERVP